MIPACVRYLRQRAPRARDLPQAVHGAEPGRGEQRPRHLPRGGHRPAPAAPGAPEQRHPLLAATAVTAGGEGARRQAVRGQGSAGRRPSRRPPDGAVGLTARVAQGVGAAHGQGGGLAAEQWQGAGLGRPQAAGRLRPGGRADGREGGMEERGEQEATVGAVGAPAGQLGQVLLHLCSGEETECSSV